MKNFILSFRIGEVLDGFNGEVSIYGMPNNGSPELLDTFPVYSSSISYDLENDSYAYYYGIVTVNSYVPHDAGGIGVNDEIIAPLVTVFSKIDVSVQFNEHTTIATLFCFNQAIALNPNNEIEIQQSHRFIRIALAMRSNFVYMPGQISKVISTSPNGLETNSFPLFNSLANLLNNCFTDLNFYRSFLSATTLNGVQPTTFLGGLYNMINNPTLNISGIFSLIDNNPITFKPALNNLELPAGHTNVPDQWTLTIKRNDSGADNFIIAGAAYIVFDKNDRGWLTTNVMAGTPNSSTFCVVLEPDGSPARFSPVTGGGLLGVGFGVTTDKLGENIYFGNFGWGPTQCNPLNGGISRFDTKGNPLSPQNGHNKGLSRVQGLNFDDEGNLWITSWGSQEPFAPADVIYPFKNKPSSIVVYRLNKLTNTLDYENPIVRHLGENRNPYLATFDVARHPFNGCMYVSCAGTNEKGLSGLYKCKLNDNHIDITAIWNNDTDPANADEFEGLRQVNFDSSGNVYVGCIATGKSRVAKLNENLIYQTGYSDQINRPWSVTIDSADNLFIGNFGAELLPNDSGELPKYQDLPTGSTGVTVMKSNGQGGFEAPYLMTLPTGGKEVMLANGFPIYGVVKSVEVDENGNSKTKDIYYPCYTPLMRITSSTVDRAGNLWVMNNWKPSATIDLLENPGGDGVVIFVGVANPSE